MSKFYFFSYLYLAFACCTMTSLLKLKNPIKVKIEGRYESRFVRSCPVVGIQQATEQHVLKDRPVCNRLRALPLIRCE